MRAGVVAVLAAVVCVFGATGASAKEGVFPDLPGLGALERLTDAQAPSVAPGTTTTSHRVGNDDRVPAPAVQKAVAADVTAADTAMIRSLPGAKHLPVLGVDAAASQRGSDGMLLALALAVVVLFTRFLFRLNTLGRPA
jgi:hypothetical protein